MLSVQEGFAVDEPDEDDAALKLDLEDDEGEHFMAVAEGLKAEAALMQHDRAAVAKIRKALKVRWLCFS